MSQPLLVIRSLKRGKRSEIRIVECEAGGNRHMRWGREGDRGEFRDRLEG